MIDKQKALDLRMQGKTYQEIADELGCSLDWCKRNLKGVKRKDISEDDYSSLVSKGRSFDCITKNEIISKVKAPMSTNKAEYNKGLMLATGRVRRKLVKEDDVIVRQAWIHPARARFSYNNMLGFINCLNDTLDEYVRMHLSECGFEDDTNYNSALAFMVLNSQFGQRIMKRQPSAIFEAISDAVDDIEDRNGSGEICIAESKEMQGISLEELPY